MNQTIINALSIDLEDWYQVPLVRIPRQAWDTCKPAVVEACDRILEFLEQKSIKATFFVSGYIAQRHPGLIATIFKAGHEIESHGYWHRLAYEQTQDEFTQDISRSSKVISEITGMRPIGYRSPAWSTSRIPDLAAKVLVSQGYIYDTSLFPTHNFLYGRMDFETSTTYFYKDTGLLEIPPSVFNVFGYKVPVTGGFYLRAYPLGLVKRLVAVRNHTRPVQIYFHPWEVIDDYPKRDIPWLHKIIQYYRCGSILERLNELLLQFRFGSLRQAYPQIESLMDKTKLGL